MSIRVMTRVWDDSRQSGTDLLALLALADRADEYGVCWPGVADIAARCRCSERHVRRMLRRLEQSGELYTLVGYGRNRTSLYLITLGLTSEDIADLLVKRFDFAIAEALETAEAITLKPDLQVQNRTLVSGFTVAKTGHPGPKGDTQVPFLDQEKGTSRSKTGPPGPLLETVKPDTQVLKPDLQVHKTGHSYVRGTVMNRQEPPEEEEKAAATPAAAFSAGLKVGNDAQEVLEVWEENAPAGLTPIIRNGLQELVLEYDRDQVLSAIVIACERGRVNLGYVRGILGRGVESAAPSNGRREEDTHAQRVSRYAPAEYRDVILH